MGPSSVREMHELHTLESAASNGLVQMLDELAKQEHKDAGSTFRRLRFLHGTKAAAGNGHLSVLQWWTSCYLPMEPLPASALAARAVKGGHLAVVQWLQSQGLVPSPESMQLVECEDAATVYWIHKKKLSMSVSVSMDAAAKAGDLKFLRWLRKHDRKYNVHSSRSALVIATSRGDLSMVKWLLKSSKAPRQLEQHLSLHHPFTDQTEMSLTPNDEAFRALVEPMGTSKAHLEVFHWLSFKYKWDCKRYRIRWITKLTLQAASQDCFLITEVLTKRDPREVQGKTHYCGWHMQMAAYYGYLDMLQWLQTEGARCDSLVVNAAAAGGQLDCLLWLLSVQTKPELNRVAMGLAAANNHLLVLQWLHENEPNYVCSTSAMDDAAANGHLEIVAWLHANRTEGCTSSAIDRAAGHNHSAVVHFLSANRTEGCTPRALLLASTNGHVEMVRWLLERLQPEAWIHEALDRAAANGHLAIVQMLVLRCKLRISQLGINQTLKNGHFHVLEWLLVHKRLSEASLVQSLS